MNIYYSIEILRAVKRIFQVIRKVFRVKVTKLVIDGLLLGINPIQKLGRNPNCSPFQSYGFDFYFDGAV